MPEMTDEQRRAVITTLYAEYAARDVLAALADGRPPVPGHGPVNAPVVIVGEAPGQEEERQGEPFVGRSGQHLRKIMGEAGLPWEACYVTNTVLWRPPGNRTPYPYEIRDSMSRVQEEVMVIGPSVLIAAGAVAFQALTSKLRGTYPQARSKWMDWHPEGHDHISVPMLTIWHPSAILQAPANRRGEMEAELRAALASVREGERVGA